MSEQKASLSANSKTGKRATKSIASFFNLNVFTTSILRARVKQLMLNMCECSEEYEPARDLFKVTMAKVKQNLTYTNEFKYSEHENMF